MCNPADKPTNLRKHNAGDEGKNECTFLEKIAPLFCDFDFHFSCEF